MSQISMFDLGASERYKIRKPIRLIELFAGIGSQAKALRNLGANFEHYGICEFDKYAVQSYNEIHGTSFATSDITKISGSDLKIVDTGTYEYIMTYSFPCIDLSLAGNQQGMAKGSGTRSGLLWEVERLLGEITELPQILLMENVPQVLNKDFGGWLEYLESKGYTNHYAKLNAKDYGIPQNRERVFMVSILGKYLYEFPEKIPLKLRLKDMLESNVDEKYYLSEKALNGLKNTTFGCSKLENRTEKNGVIPTLCARDYKDPKLVLVAQLDGFESSGRVYVENKPIRLGGIFDNETKHQAGSVWDKENISPTIDTMQGGWRQPMIIEDFYKNREPREYGDTAPTLRSERQGLKVVEPIPKERFFRQTIETANENECNSINLKKSNIKNINSENAPKINTMDGGQREPKIIVDKIVRKVEIRKNEVDIEGLQKILRENKSLSCKNIAEKLGIPQTKAEHWFRVDSGFAIPDREIWLELKELLGITDNSFDAQIMAFEIIDNNYDMGNRTYDMNGLSPTITGTSTPLIKKGIRIPENTKKGYAIAEIGDGVYINRPHQKRGCVQKDCIQTIKTSSNDIGVVVPNQTVSDYRIRKLTPKECWRLMGFSDTDFDKTTCSNAQLYKQAGNSIVVNVLMAIFRELL